MEKKEIFKQFLDENEVLIVDKNPSSRNRLLKTMVDLGTKRHTVHTSGSIHEAEEILKTKKIGVVLSDYLIGGGSGFDLFKMIREQQPHNKELCLILVTSNISQTAVAKAAEEDVDSFIIKPYTIQSIQENLISTIAAKVKPSDYVLKIEEGKNLIGLGKYDEALTALNEAMEMHTKPALALFYIGQAEYLMNAAEKARGSYNKGLAFNSIHYKCLIGLYEIFMRDHKYFEAYEVVKKVAKVFPANPDRLTQIVRLAIQTKNYNDMQMFYEIFTTLDERTPLLINYLGAGMFISGKHSLLTGEPEAAMKYFDNIAVSCSEFSKFIRAMISLLVEHNKAMDALKFLTRFPAGSDDLEDFLVSDYLVSSKTINDQNYMIKAGLDLYNKKIRDYQCMQIMIDAMKAKGYKRDKLEPFIKEMAALWPEKVTVKPSEASLQSAL